MAFPLISVYITNYNYQTFIQSSIESVLGQTLQDFELLIIDDGSTDNSKSIIEKYRSYPKVTIIYQQNKGLNITNNVAMRVAKGKYLMRLDADDYLTTDALEIMSGILEKDPDLGLVFPDYFYTDADGNITGEERRHNFEKEVSLYDQPAHGACTMIRLSFLKKLGGYNESFTCQDGYDLWIKFVTHYKVTNINRPLFYYRRHGNNLTTNESRILATRIKIKEAFVREHFALPTTLAIIPVRNTMIGNVNWPLWTYNDKSILEHKVETCLGAANLAAVVVTSADEEILAFCLEKFDGQDRVHIVERPKEFESPNQSLALTMERAVSHVQHKGLNVGTVMTVSLEYPFINSEVLDDVVHTFVLFKSDSVLSVRPDNRMYYQHVGHGMVPILDQEKFTKLEREALYRGAGGVMLTAFEQFEKTKKNLSGNVGHVVVDSKMAFGVFDAFDFALFRQYAEADVFAA